MVLCGLEVLCKWIISTFLCLLVFPRYPSEIYHGSPTVIALAESPHSRVTDAQIEKAFQTAYKNATEREKLQAKLEAEGRVVSRDEKIADLSLNRYFQLDPKGRSNENVQEIFSLATTNLFYKYSLTQDYVNNDLPNRKPKGKYGQRATQNCEAAIRAPNCDRYSKYRTANGTCNNLDNPLWGSIFHCFQRLQPAEYVGTSEFRQSVLGGPLPEPRVLSVNIHSHVNRPTDLINHLFMFFGQLLDHDMLLVVPTVTDDNQAIRCCPLQAEMHPACAPIMVPPDDPFYPDYNVSCLNFVRNAKCPTCQLGPRKQSSQTTNFIDCSFLYGNTDNETNEMRTNDGTGKLRIQQSRVGDLLPPRVNSSNDQCSVPAQNQICFRSGDPRINQNPGLVTQHTLFMREHNRIADVLRALNRHWNDERLFQEARKILGAMMQVIAYKEFLPIALGNERMSYFNLWISRNQATLYDRRTNPTMFTEFTTAAFRFGHTLINSILAGGWPNGQGQLLRDSFFQPFQFYYLTLGSFLANTNRSPAQFFDRHLVPDVRNFLYKTPDRPTGLDLPAINIQRGRDHGLPTYATMVRYCSNNDFNLRTFDDLTRFELMSAQNADLLRKYYRDVRDVDLFTGMTSETYNPGAVIGPTATCIVGTQFNRLKYGDRFYFEHHGTFTYQQREQLKKMTLSQMICLNTDVTEMPMNAMLYPSRDNIVISCNKLSGIDLSYWKER